MNKFKSILIAVTLGSTVFFSSCKDDENSDLLLDNYNTGKVTCIVDASFEAGEDNENVPDGTQVVFEAAYSNYNPDITDGNIIKVFEISGGKVEANLNVPSNGALFTIRVIGFEAEYDDGIEGTDDYNALFEGTSTVMVKPYDNKIKKITCTHEKI